MNSILICGITSIEDYPKSICVKNCKQCVEKMELCLPLVKLDIEEPNEIHADVCVENVRMIETVLGAKLIIEGKVKVKLIYTADNRIQSIHSAHWEKTFCNYILLREVEGSRCDFIVRNVFAGIEDVSITCVEKRGINLSIIFILCPQITEDRNSVASEDCCCIRKVNLNKIEICNMPMGRNIKIVEYTNNACSCMEKEEKNYRCEDLENENEYCRQQNKNDSYNVYNKTRRKRGY